MMRPAKENDLHLTAKLILKLISSLLLPVIFAVVAAIAGQWDSLLWRCNTATQKYATRLLALQRRRVTQTRPPAPPRRRRRT